MHHGHQRWMDTAMEGLDGPQGWFTPTLGFGYSKKRNKRTQTSTFLKMLHCFKLLPKVKDCFSGGGQKSYNKHRRSSFLKWWEKILKKRCKAGGKRGSWENHKDLIWKIWEVQSPLVHVGDASWMCPLSLLSLLCSFNVQSVPLPLWLPHPELSNGERTALKRNSQGLQTAFGNKWEVRTTYFLALFLQCIHSTAASTE